MRDKVDGGEARGDIGSRAIDDGRGTAAARMVRATGRGVRHCAISVGDVVAVETGALVRGSSYVDEFARLGVAHGQTRGRGLVVVLETLKGVLRCIIFSGGIKQQSSREYIKSGMIDLPSRNLKFEDGGLSRPGAWQEMQLLRRLDLDIYPISSSFDPSRSRSFPSIDRS